MKNPTPTPAAAPKLFSIADAPIVKGADLRDGAEYRAKANELEVGDAIADMPKDAAGRLYRAIEEAHGPRTATQRCKDGLYTVKRVETRPARQRAARKAAPNA